MIKKILIAILIVLFFVRCGTGKRMVSEAELQKINTIIENDTITIEANWASPMNVLDIANTNLLPIGSNAAKISLIGNSNYFKIIGDSLSIALPYYGEQQIAGTYNPSNVGISFNGIPSEFKYEFNQKKIRHDYFFEVKSDVEILRINLNIFPNLRTNIMVNSSHRTFISYNGSIIEAAQ